MLSERLKNSPDGKIELNDYEIAVLSKNMKPPGSNTGGPENGDMRFHTLFNSLPPETTTVTLDSEGNMEIESNYRLVLSIAKKYHRNDINFEDLLQESSIGLLKAVDRFDPELGYKFSTYACWWIKQAALQYINENVTDIKVPTHSRLLNSKIKKAINKFENDHGRAPSYKEVGELVGEKSFGNPTASICQISPFSVDPE